MADEENMSSRATEPKAKETRDHIIILIGPGYRAYGTIPG